MQPNNIDVYGPHDYNNLVVLSDGEKAAILAQLDIEFPGFLHIDGDTIYIEGKRTYYKYSTLWGSHPTISNLKYICEDLLFDGSKTDLLCKQIYLEKYNIIAQNKRAQEDAEQAANFW